jgi:hypothetical protein
MRRFGLARSILSPHQQRQIAGRRLKQELLPEIVGNALRN